MKQIDSYTIYDDPPRMQVRFVGRGNPPGRIAAGGRTWEWVGHGESPVHWWYRPAVKKHMMEC